VKISFPLAVASPAPSGVPVSGPGVGGGTDGPLPSVVVEEVVPGVSVVDGDAVDDDTPPR